MTDASGVSMMLMIARSINALLCKCTSAAGNVGDRVDLVEEWLLADERQDDPGDHQIRPQSGIRCAGQCHVVIHAAVCRVLHHC